MKTVSLKIYSNEGKAVVWITLVFSWFSSEFTENFSTPRGLREGLLAVYLFSDSIPSLPGTPTSLHLRASGLGFTFDQTRKHAPQLIVPPGYTDILT